LNFDFIAILNYGANDSVLDFPVVQVDADLVADFELSVIGPGWHGRMYHKQESRISGASFGVGKQSPGRADIPVRLNLSKNMQILA